MDFFTPTLSWIVALHRQTWLHLPMQAVTTLGNEEFFLLLLPVIYWCLDRRRGAQLGLLLLFSVLVNDVFKVALASPRPFWLDPALGPSPELSFGFPSGHAQNAAALWTFLAVRSRNPRLWVPLALVLVLIVAFSRLALGLHFPADALGGALLGFAILGGALKAEPTLTAWWHRAESVQRVLAGAVVAALLAGLYVLLTLRLPIETDATPYAKAVANAHTWKDVTTRTAAFLGLVVGLAIAKPFDTEGEFPIKLMRFLLGAVGLAVFYLGLKLPFVPDVLPLRFVRYFLTTFWVTGLAPLVFARVGLLNQPSAQLPDGAIDRP